MRPERRLRPRSAWVVAALVVLASAGGVGYASVATPATGTAPSGSYQAVTPLRIMDTIYTHTPVAAGGTVSLAVAGVNGVPADATAVVLNVTAAQGTQLGSVTVWPDGVTRPLASNVNYLAGQTVPNLVVATIGTDGKIDFYNNSAGTVHLIADLAGYYAPGSTNTLVVPGDGTAAQNGAALATALASLTGSTPTVVQLQPGTYALAQQTAVPGNTWIQGAGRTNTIVSETSENYVLGFLGSGGNNGLANLTINAILTDGIAVNNATDVQGVNILVSGNNGIDLEGTVSLNVDDTTITSTNATGTGVQVGAGTLNMQDSTVQLVGNEAFAFFGGQGFVRDSVVNNAGGHDSFDVSSATVDVANSEIVGEARVSTGAFMTCVGNYNASFVGYGTTC